MGFRYETALEPSSLVQQFVDHPPAGFEASLTAQGIPVFLADYDLMTTLDEGISTRLRKLPGYSYWQRHLRWRTCFVGCTTTEYLPMPQASAEQTVAALLSGYGDRCRLLVVKDIAVDSPLLDTRVNRSSAAFVSALQASGFALLEGMPLAWLAIDFQSIDEYLQRLSTSRRKDMRRKLKSRDALLVQCVETGDAWFSAEAIEQCYALYLSVHAQSEVHFDLLSRQFFAALLRDRSSGGRVFLYFAQEQLIGWNLCYIYEGKLVDKYIGLRYPQARQFNLYFVSWVHNLQYALDEGLSHYVAGWTDSRVKRQLGATVTSTWHAVWVRNGLLRPLLRRCVRFFQKEADGGG